MTGEADSSIGLYSNEYSMFLTFTEDGKKLAKIEEMFDSAYAVTFFQKLDEHTRSVGR